MLISAPAALPLAAFWCIAVGASNNADFLDLIFWLFIIPLGWASAFGPAIVKMTEWIYLRAPENNSTEP